MRYSRDFFQPSKRHTIPQSAVRKYRGLGQMGIDTQATNEEWSRDGCSALRAHRDSQAALDDLIDFGAMAEPVRGFPRKFFNETLSLARDLYHQHRGLTPLRCAELAISQTYQKHKYVPSWNAQYFPEREIAAAL